MNNPAIRNQSFWYKLKKTEIVKNRGLYLLLLPALLFIVVFAYFPMLGVVIAFEDYDPVKGFFGSPFVKMENFKFFFSSSSWLQVTVNTLYLNVLFIRRIHESKDHIKVF